MRVSRPNHPIASKEDQGQQASDDGIFDGIYENAIRKKRMDKGFRRIL
jgi:hypothetical protein